MKRIIYIYLCLIAGSALIALLGIKIYGINIGFVLLTLEFCYLVLSFGIVEADEIAGLFIFGKPIEKLFPGLYFAPWGIYKVRKFKRTVHNDELPAPPEKVFHGDGNAPYGMFDPIRIKFGQPQKDDSDELKNDPYNYAMVTEVVPVVIWKIVDAITFFTVMGTEENCRQNLTDKTIAIFGDDLSQMTPAKALLNLHDVSQKMENDLKLETSDWGIELIDAYLKPFVFSHGLNEVVLEVPKAERLAKATVIRADAEKTKKEKEGDGDAYAKKVIGIAEAEVKASFERLTREARAIGMEEILNKVGKTKKGQLVLWMETLETALKEANYSIIPGSDLFSAASGLQEMLNKVKGGIKWEH